jgi:hypothetical protein
MEREVVAENLRALADNVPFDARTRQLLERAADLLDPDGDTCGARLPQDARVYVCDLPADHSDAVHQESGGITWRTDGQVI